ncbi:MAG: DUF2283 domain-containing protein [bacterium]
MKIEYDKEADALYISIKEDYVERTDELDNGISLDFDKGGNLIGVEILYATKKYSKQDIFNLTTKNLMLESV